MRRLIHYSLGVAAAAGAEALLVYGVYLLGCGSLTCVPYVDWYRVPSASEVLCHNYFMEMWGAVGGLLGPVVAARFEFRHSWGLSFLQGIVAMLAPLAVRNFLTLLSATDIAVWASAGVLAALLPLGLYIGGSVVVRWATAIYRVWIT
jgi:hypothetical protein